MIPKDLLESNSLVCSPHGVIDVSPYSTSIPQPFSILHLPHLSPKGTTTGGPPHTTASSQCMSLMTTSVMMVIVLRILDTDIHGCFWGRFFLLGDCLSKFPSVHFTFCMGPSNTPTCHHLSMFTTGQRNITYIGIGSRKIS